MTMLEKQIQSLEKKIEKTEFSNRTPDWKWEQMNLQLEELRRKVKQ